MQAARAALRGLIATLLGAAPEHIALTYSTTDGCNIVLAGLGLRPGDEIVTTDAEHFGLAGPVFASGATVRVAQVHGLEPGGGARSDRRRGHAAHAPARRVARPLDDRHRARRARAQGAHRRPRARRRRAVGGRDPGRRRRARLLHGVGAEVALRAGHDRRALRRRRRGASRRAARHIRAGVASSRAADTSHARERSASTPAGCRSRRSWDLRPRSASRRSGGSRGSARWPRRAARRSRAACRS